MEPDKAFTDPTGYLRDVLAEKQAEIASLRAKLEIAEKALAKATQLADIAIDWHLEEVEIDDEMVDTHDLRDEFDAALTAIREGRE